MDLTQELAIATRLAREAGEKAREFLKRDFRDSREFKVEYKDASEPVTEADRELNAFILAGLERAFPGDGLVGEENAATARWQGCERIWYVDPIDGTKHFVLKDPDFAVMIGLAIAGRAHLGVVYCPLRDELHAGVVGVGAWREGPNGGGRRALRVGANSELSRLRMVVSRAHRSRKTDALRDALGLQYGASRGSVGLKCAMIAGDEADLYAESSGKAGLWDSCAPEALLKAAGGEVTDLHGRRLDYALGRVPEFRNLHGILASNGPCHAEIVSRIASVVSEFGI